MNIVDELERRFKLQDEYLGTEKTINKAAPMVSVLVATYQHRDYIKACLEGILMQKTDFQVEIILGEDESTDGTREICIDYANKYPDKIRLFLRDRKLSQLYDENGNYICRFNGPWNRMSARGKYIAYCEGDDYWTEPFKLQKQVDILENNSDCVFVYSDYNVFIEKTKKHHLSMLKNKKYIPNTDNISSELLIANYIATLTVCARTDLMNRSAERILSGNAGHLLSDLIFWLEMSHYGKFYFIDEPLATYRVLEESAVHSKNPLIVIKAIMFTYAQKQYFINQYGCTSELKNNIDCNYYYDLLKNAFLLKDKNIGQEAFRNLSKIDIYGNKKYASRMFIYGLKYSLLYTIIMWIFKIKRHYSIDY